MTESHELSAELCRKVLACFSSSAGESSPKMRLGFREPIHAQQIAWPADGPLSEAELRSEIRSLCDSAQALHERAQELFDRLPEPPDGEFEDEVPPSVYFVLVNAVSMITDHVPEILKSVDRQFVATPESLRGEWLEDQLKRIGGRFGGRDAKEARQRVVAAVGRIDLDE